MRITDWMVPARIKLGLTVEEWEELLKLLPAEDGLLLPIGAGVALGRIEDPRLEQPQITAVTLREGVELGAPDGEKSRLIFMIAQPPCWQEEPLARLRVLLMDENLREQLLLAEDAAGFLGLLMQVEAGIKLEEQAAFRLPPCVLLLGGGCLLAAVGRLLGLGWDALGEGLRLAGEILLGGFTVWFCGQAGYRLAEKRGLLWAAGLALAAVFLLGGSISCVVVLWITIFCTHKVL